MNKKDLVNEVAKIVGTKRDAQSVVDSVFSSISDALSRGETVSLVGFGTFKTSKRAARTGRNPQTGDLINIKARNVPKFTPGKALKDSVN